MTIHELENYIQTKHAELKDLARRKGRHFAKRNLPAAVGDFLAHYTEELKSGYEKLIAEVFKHLQPASHFPEAKIDHDAFKEKDGELDAKIEHLHHEIQNDEYALGDFHPDIFYNRIRWLAVVTLIFVSGEIIFNTMAFQVTGETMLIALILSISVSCVVTAFSHLVAFVYKMMKTAYQRRILVTASLLSVIGVFIVLAILRTRYLATHDVHISPVFFVIFNLFYFIVSTVLSFFALPTWAEVRQSFTGLKLYKAIHKRKQEIARLQQQKQILKEAHVERTKQHVRSVNEAKYLANEISKMYMEAVAIFKGENLAHRSDGRTPDCFSQQPPPPDTDDSGSKLINPINK